MLAGIVDTTAVLAAGHVEDVTVASEEIVLPTPRVSLDGLTLTQSPTSNQTRAVETLKGEPSSFVTSLKLCGVMRLVIMASSRWITLAVNFPC